MPSRSKTACRPAQVREADPHSRRPRVRPRYTRPEPELLEDRCLLSASILDPTFGHNGIVTTDFSSASVTRGSVGYAVAVQPDGKILEAGAAGDAGGGSFALA